MSEQSYGAYESGIASYAPLTIKNTLHKAT